MLRFKGKKRAVAAATARLRGLNQIRPPSKTQAFFGAPELRPSAGVICHRALTFMYIMHHDIKKLY